MLDGRHSAERSSSSVFMHPESYYNRVRIHSELAYLTLDVSYQGDLLDWCLSKGL
ncbi:MAG: hypothetical protein LBH75_03990 [Treponema sp.]|nr:hypothetical protein [Treponema sp.]